MSSITSALGTAGQALGAYQQALEVVQNNITNSSTPGYAKQSLNLESLAFDSTSGLAGGVAARGLNSARDEYAEEEVRRQMQSMGRFEAQAQGVASIENLIDVSGKTGIAADLSALMQSLSAWSVAPSSPSARQSVIDSAQNFADSVHRFSAGIAQTASNVQTQIGSTTDQINQIAEAIRQDNVDRARTNSTDPGLDARVHASLEQLAELVDVSTVSQADGTVSVILKGGAPLVVGSTRYPISASLGVSGAVNPQAPPSSQILDWQGADITAQITGGTLGGLLDVRNRVLTALTGDGQKTGTLNSLVSAFADAVNSALQSGFTGPEAGAPHGQPLFVYDTADPTLAAGSFRLNPGITADGLAPVDASGNVNGNALALASLADSPSSALGGVGYAAFYGGIVAAVGQESATAQDNQQTQRQVVAQTQTLRDQSSGVSLDEQAVMLLQYQRSYQAVAKLLTTLDSMMETTINLIP